MEKEKSNKTFSQVRTNFQKVKRFKMEQNGRVDHVTQFAGSAVVKRCFTVTDCTVKLFS